VEFPDELTDCIAEAMEAVIAVGEKAAKKASAKK